MEQFVIEGNTPLSGTVTPGGNKNAALPLLAASLLTDQPLVLHNVPRIRDVQIMCQLLADLGVDITEAGRAHAAAACAPCPQDRPRPDLCRDIRASILLAGPDAGPPGTRGVASARRRCHRTAAARYALSGLQASWARRWR